MPQQPIEPVVFEINTVDKSRMYIIRQLHSTVTSPIGY